MTEFGVETLVLLPKFGITDVGDSKIALFIIIIITRVDFFIPVAPLRVVTLAVLAYTVSDPPPRAFTVAGPRLWNSLPPTLRRSDTERAEFKQLSKTHLFTVAETTAH